MNIDVLVATTLRTRSDRTCSSCADSLCVCGSGFIILKEDARGIEDLVGSTLTLMTPDSASSSSTNEVSSRGTHNVFGDDQEGVPSMPLTCLHKPPMNLSCLF